MQSTKSIWLVPLAGLLQAGSLCAQIEAVPPLYAPPGAAAKRLAAPSLLTPADAQPFAIGLPAPTLKEQSAFKAANARVAGGVKTARAQRKAPLRIGYMRPSTTGEQALAPAALKWYPVAGGGMAARVTVDSPGAAALRLGLTLRAADAGMTLRFSGAAGAQQVFGPYSAATVAAGPIYWSPVLEGQTATLEIHLPEGVQPGSIALAIPSVGHMVIAGAALGSAGTAKAWNLLAGIGAAGACEQDVKCVAPTAALTAQAAATAIVVLNDSRYVYQCTATLLNDSTATRTPYLYTANHCLASEVTTSSRSTPAQMAATVNTYWFFDATSCASRDVPPYALVAGGATLLGRGDDYDWALLRMNAAPPAGASFSAWRAQPMQPSDFFAVLHHPKGDLKKYSEGTVAEYTTYDDGSSFITTRYSLGVTESGSSGSGLLSLNGRGGYYELRGGLYGGSSDCSVKSGTDDYSRMDIALPLVAQYLTPDAANPKQLGTTVEFYNRTLDDFFITADPTETRCLDTGCLTGWERTGLRFLAYANRAVAPADATPVCRFYVTPKYGDSHFYSADPAECAATATQFKDAWVEESPNLFYIQTPHKATGACPANTQPVYRFLNSADKLHHRYTAEVDVRNCMLYGSNPPDPNTAVDLNCTANAGEWIQEGYGVPPDAPVMCAPKN